MKFLCVGCNDQMLLSEVQSRPEAGSLSVIFSCPKCAHSTAMLTNAGETQLLNSLGLKLKPAAKEQGRGCPFASMLQPSESRPDETPPEPDGIRWSDDARQRLENIPELIRPMAQMGIEKYAESRGIRTIDLAVLEAAKNSFGM